MPIRDYIARRLAVPACEPAAVSGRDLESLAWQAERITQLEAALGDRGAVGCTECHGAGYVEQHVGIDYETDTAEERAATWRKFPCECRRMR